ncbi:hypothetical protein HPP92_024118 [Vanilla planifolia]|uniref:Phytocyanin domain-containing protein n=1 Tax=Vanilla planifolia TaxID=51239 RepID=A0A835UCZ7_VANPL|nr:hypothetical protein HPP92_024118 [Vanilla planifolia]
MSTVAATIFVVVILPIASAAKSYTVGDSNGWTVLPNNASFYADWASTKTFVAGDKLVFNFQTGSHDVVEVPKSSFDSCSTNNQVGSTLNNGPATVTLTAGKHYYFCNIPGHCSLGQKLAVSVSSSSPAPSSSSSPSPGGEVPEEASGPAPPQTPGGPPSSAPQASSLSLAAVASAGLSLFAVAFW